MTDFLKEYPRIAHVILGRKHWYCPKTGSFMKDLKVLLKMDGYSADYLDDTDVFNIIVNFYEEYVIWAIQNGRLRHSHPISELFRPYNWNAFKMSDQENTLRNILSFFLMLDKDDILLPTPHYDKHTPKPSFYKPGMTYAYMNKYAKEVFEGNRKEQAK